MLIRFNIQIAEFGFIYETDVEFADIENTFVRKQNLRDEKYFKEYLNNSYLIANQKEAHWANKRHLLISECVKIAKGGKHSVKLISSSKTKMENPTGFCEILKEVNKQIDVLLALVLDETSEIEHGPPVIFVSRFKKAICEDFNCVAQNFQILLHSSQILPI